MLHFQFTPSIFLFALDCQSTERLALSACVLSAHYMLLCGLTCGDIQARFTLLPTSMHVI